MDASLRLLLVASLLLAAQVAHNAHALKCRTEDDDQEEFREVARQCMSNVSNWDRPADDRGGGPSGTGSGREWRRPGRGGNGVGNNGNSNGGGQDSRNGGYGYGTRDNTRNQMQKNRNGNNNNNNSNRNNQQANNQGTRNMNDGYNRNDKNNKDSSESSIENSDLEHIEPCIVHCIFRQMQMLDEDSYPDRQGVTNIMMRNVQDSRVQDFVEQAVDECFDLIESDNRNNKCESSKNLVMCLEEKGRQKGRKIPNGIATSLQKHKQAANLRKNCEDWDDPPDQNKQRGNTNRNNNSRNQQRDSNGYS